MSVFICVIILYLAVLNIQLFTYIFSAPLHKKTANLHHGFMPVLENWDIKRLQALDVYKNTYLHAPVVAGAV